MPKRVNYYIPEPLIERLKKLATKRDVSVSELVRRALEEFVTKEERERKRKIRRYD